MTIAPMVLAIDIQSQDVRPYDYVEYLSKVINTSLTIIKNNSDALNFKHYSLLMHMILYEEKEMGIWGEELGIKYLDNDENYRPVKMWTSIWGSICGRSHYFYFEEYFLKPLY